MKNNYDRVAWFYDPLSRIVFRNAQIQAQQALIPYIPEHANILIAGGGTGGILEAIADQYPAGLRITYVEISEKMIRKAEKRFTGKNTVTFVHSAIEDYAAKSHFDVVITAFLFDNFTQEKADRIFQKLDKLLQPDGKWLFTDFHIDKKSSRSWKTWLLKSMYLFFKFFSEVEASQLPDTTSLFKKAGYHAIFTAFWYRKFIHSSIYQKP
ncbi:class I SAM-dependent methyltransferase [Dyadobacter sp. Leaf189]|uniref:class I SAM-dependent methyltransferase n=1 Tax=Dyadobacter sp. Leaf189 TaxID=1736295 RepID=UPI000B3094C8|nr:class I SAM-dependent methyltransferase [Dyadobacter sp. Leaf189]